MTLVDTFWPLFLTTNYDDCILAAAFARKFRYQARGRSLEDCHSILRSLGEPQASAVWYLQGFIGGHPSERTHLAELPNWVIA